MQIRDRLRVDAIIYYQFLRKDMCWEDFFLRINFLQNRKFFYYIWTLWARVLSNVKTWNFNLLIPLNQKACIPNFIIVVSISPYKVFGLIKMIFNLRSWPVTKLFLIIPAMAARFPSKININNGWPPYLIVPHEMFKLFKCFVGVVQCIWNKHNTYIHTDGYVQKFFIIKIYIENNDADLRTHHIRRKRIEGLRNNTNHAFSHNNTRKLLIKITTVMVKKLKNSYLKFSLININHH